MNPVQVAGQAGESAAWLSFVALAIAALSAIFSAAIGLSNRATAKRALALSEAQEARRDARLVLHLNESVSWRRSEQGERLLGFHVLVTNPTDRPTSLLGSDLHVAYSASSVMTTVKVPHDPSLATGRPAAEIAPIGLPAPLDANGALSGWFLFRVPDGLTGGRPAERYDLVVRDVHEILETMQVTVFREVTDD
jgi:hypothetical protein